MKVLIYIVSSFKLVVKVGLSEVLKTHFSTSHFSVDADFCICKIDIMKEEQNFQNLLAKFFAGEITDSELGSLKEWLESDYENRRLFNDQNEIWQEASLHSRIKNYKIESAWKNTSSKLGLGRKDKSYTILNKSYFRAVIRCGLHSVCWWQ
jgi:hypothetical protein